MAGDAKRRAIPILRAIAYLAGLALVTAGLALVEPGPKELAEALVPAATTLVVAMAAIEALIANRGLVQETQDLSRATREAAQATEKEAAASLAAVEAANRSTTEQRRIAILASVPFVRVARPSIGEWDEGWMLAAHVRNMGPGPALQVRMTVEASHDGSPGSFHPARTESWPVGMIDEGDGATLRLAADDYRSVGAPAVRGREPTTLPEIVPSHVRLHVTWMSTLGAKAEHVWTWHVRLTERDPILAWTFDLIRLDPGPENGGEIVSRAPET